MNKLGNKINKMEIEVANDIAATTHDTYITLKYLRNSIDKFVQRLEDDEIYFLDIDDISRNVSELNKNMLALQALMQNREFLNEIKKGIDKND